MAAEEETVRPVGITVTHVVNRGGELMDEVLVPVAVGHEAFLSS